MQYIKAILLIIFTCFQSYLLCAQTFMGAYSTENTILMVKQNPTFAISGDRAQFNIGGIGTDLGSNCILFNRSIYSFLTHGTASTGKDYIKNYANSDRTLWLNTEISGPGVSFNINKKHYFAFTTGIRYLINADHLDNSVFMSMGGSNPDSEKNKTLTLNNFSFTSQMFKEINFSYATFFHNSEDFSLAGGATVKLLVGIGAFGLGIPNAKYSTIGNEGVANNVTGNANFYFTPYANRLILTNSPMGATKVPTNDIGIGGDIGLIYYVHVNNSMQRKRNYQVRIAASVTDIGSISYTASSTSGSYSTNSGTINYKNIQNTPQQTFGNRVFNEYLLYNVIKATNDVSKFSMGLPTAFHLNADINVVGEYFYINTNFLLNLRSQSATNFSNHYINSVSLTPRYIVNKSSDIGFGMPFTFNSINQGCLGGVAFVGPFYIGSGSIFNALITNRFNAIDIYTGLTLRIKPKGSKEREYMMM